MANSSSPTRLAEWSLGAFHTSLFVMVLFLSGFLVSPPGYEDHNTPIGLAVSVSLWLLTYLFTRQVVRRLVDPANWSASKISLRNGLILGAFWGGVNGLVFYYAYWILSMCDNILHLGPAVAVGDDLGTFLGANAFFLLVGSIPALTIGATFGLAFAVVDMAMLAASQLLYRLNGRGIDPGA